MMTTCTAQSKSGKFCDKPGLPDAPYPICSVHARLAYWWVRDQITEAAWDPATMLGLRDRDPVPTKVKPSVVYYLLVGELVKIGRTADLPRRLTQYPPNVVLLATEPGGADIEADRLARFRTLRASGREWFHPGIELREHIEGLAAVAV